MNKRAGGWSFKNIKSLSLVELMISIMVVGMMFLSFFSLETFSHKQVLNADRRTKVQNNLSYCLEHMSKYVLRAAGTINSANRAIALYPTGCTPGSPGTCTGFQIRVDLNYLGNIPPDAKDRQTPSDFSDDAVVYYELSGNNLITGCKTSPGNCYTYPTEVAPEILSSKIVAGVSNTDPLPANISADPTAATSGFFVVVDPSGSFVDVGLVGRYDPDVLPTRLTKLTNPQVGMKARLICNNASTH